MLLKGNNDMAYTKIDQEFGSIMIIVPHQDDELLLTAGIIKQAVLSHVPVHVVMATNGDYGCSDYTVGRMRLNETIEGLKVLGLSSKHVTFLGYADTGMPESDSFLAHLYNMSEDEVLPSHCSRTTYGLVKKQDFHYEKYGEHCNYTRRNFRNDLQDVIAEMKPLNIFTTSEYDTHGDHSGLYKFVVEILHSLNQESTYTPNLYSGIVHSLAGDEKWPLKEVLNKPFSCPNDFELTSKLKWDKRIIFSIPKEMIKNGINEKYKALSKHKTALKPDAVDFLYSFVKSDEVFWQIKWEEDTDATK